MSMYHDIEFGPEHERRVKHYWDMEGLLQSAR